MRNMPVAGFELIEDEEGTILHTYDDLVPGGKPFLPGMKQKGTLTIGTGHTGPDVLPGMTITRERARELLDRDLRVAQAAVEQLVTVPLNDNQYAALVSFTFNVGTDIDADNIAEGFGDSTLLKKLNKGDYASVPGELNKWVNSKGQKLKGLVRRRAREGALFMTPTGATSPITKPLPDDELSPRTDVHKEVSPVSKNVFFLLVGGIVAIFIKTFFGG